MRCTSSAVDRSWWRGLDLSKTVKGILISNQPQSRRCTQVKADYSLICSCFAKDVYPRHPRGGSAQWRQLWTSSRGFSGEQTMSSSYHRPSNDTLMLVTRKLVPCANTSHKKLRAAIPQFLFPPIVHQTDFFQEEKDEKGTKQRFLQCLRELLLEE